MSYKQTTIEIKAATGYTFSGYASVWEVVDSHNDVTVEGSFSGSIAKWESNKFLSPIYLMYNHKSKNKPIGKITLLREDNYGLFIKAELTQGLPIADKLVKSGLKDKGLSIGYFANDYYEENGIRYLTDIDLVEVSIVDNASNPDAMIIEQKNVNKASVEDFALLIETLNTINKKVH